MIRYGPAGWSYKDWAGLVYPAKKPKGFDELQYIAGYFETVEINSTFYRPASEKTARSWVRRVEQCPDFRFTAKLHQRFTHQRRSAWTTEEVRDVRAGMDPILESGKMGALLLQFPWSFRRTDENREWLDDLATTFGDFPLVLEVRHETWNTAAFFEALADRGIGFVNIDQPLFGDSIAPSARATSRVGYVRVHGRNYSKWFAPNAESHERYDYLYPAAELAPWAERVREVAAQPTVQDVYVVTNNHYRGKGVANALMLKALVEGSPQAAPEDIVQEYRETLGGLVHAR